MANLLRSELYKLWKDPTFRMMAIVYSAVAVLISLTCHFLVVNQEAYTALVGLGYGLQMNILLLKIALAVLGGFFVTGEHGTGIMKLNAASGYSRWRIYAARFGGYGAGIVALALLTPLITAGMGLLLNGFGHMEEAAGGWYFLRMIGLTVLYAAAFASIMAVFAMRTTVSGVMIGAALLGLLFIDGVSGWLGNQWELYRVVYEHSVFKQFMEMAVPQLSAGQAVQMTVIPAATILLCVPLGMWLFSRMEIK